jgi:pyrimidine operon attenuation protein / uracil phosphoribosyltransferase
MTTHVPERAPGTQLRQVAELFDSGAVAGALARIAHELIERNADVADVLLVGIHTRGVPLALRLRQLVTDRSGVELPVGTLDITLHRDDQRAGPPLPSSRATEIPVPLVGRTVVLVDDVMSTGRTIRAAIDTLLELGRPELVQVAVLVDRGHRELPIRPDYVGKNVPTSREERIQVELVEVDGIDRVVLQRGASDG